MIKFTPKDIDKNQQKIIDGIHSIPFGTPQYEQYRRNNIIPIIEENEDNKKYVLVMKGEFDKTLSGHLRGEISNIYDVDIAEEDLFGNQPVLLTDDFKYSYYPNVVKNMEVRSVEVGVICETDSGVLLPLSKNGLFYAPKAKPTFSRTSYVKPIMQMLIDTAVGVGMEHYNGIKKSMFNNADLIVFKGCSASKELSVMSILFVLKDVKASNNKEDMVHVLTDVINHDKMPYNDFMLRAYQNTK